MTKIAIDLEIVIKDPPMMGDAKGSDIEILDEISKLKTNEEKEKNGHFWILFLFTITSTIEAPQK